MRTIFITSFHAHISRNILATEAFRRLAADSNLRVVLLVPPHKAAYFTERFGGENVVVEGIPLYRSSRTRRGLLFKRLGMFLIDSDTRRLKLGYKYHRDRRLGYFLFARGMGFLGRSRIIRAFVRVLDYRFSPRDLFAPLFDRYAPQAVFATDVHNENDVSLMQDARRRGIPMLGMFRSWDNPTQAALRIFPDILLVGSDEIAAETVRWQGLPRARIEITGHPHYDRYRGGPTETREAFCVRFGLNPRNPIIFFAPVGDKFMAHNDLDEHTLTLLAELGHQVLVRFPPDERVTLRRFVRPPHVAFHQPGHVFSPNTFEDREIRAEDDESLMNSICYSDVVVCGPTSILLDAAFFDKPVVAVNIPPTRRHFYDAVYCYGFTHVRRALAAGGIRYAETRDELSRAVASYLSNPALEKYGRAAIRARWFSHADGRAGERVADAALRILYRERVS